VLQPVQKRELGVTANVLLSLIDRMKEISPPLPRRYSQMKAEAYNVNGRIALDEGSEESARRAVIHFENQLKVNESIGHDEGIAHAKASIAVAKSLYEVGNNEEVLKTSHESYELHVSKFGDDDGDTIHTGLIYAINLQRANRGGKQWIF